MRTGDLYQSVTNSIIKQLEDGIIPWTQPWTTSAKGVAYVPTNVSTGRQYSGANILILWAQAMEKGYHSHGWMTFKQASELGARVQKGERGTNISFIKWDEKPDEESGEMKKRSILKAYTVFHVDQLQKLPEGYQVQSEPPPDDTVYEGALRLLKECGIRVSYNGQRAAYYPQRDEVVMPPYSTFESDEEFYGVAFHELAHATGHKDRLNRNLMARFDKEARAMEELVAELSSAFICASVGIPARHRSASYVENWLNVFKQDKRAVFTAASYASHAANWLHEQIHAVQDDTPDVEKQPAREEELAV